MNNYQDWANLVARKLKGEGDVIAAIDKEELDDSAATEVFVRNVLESFLPENYGIGSGRVVDAFGNRSDFMDVIIYNRSFPRIGMRGTQSDYLYESVLATFVIRAKYVRKTFFESMDACASMARLMTNVDKTVLVQLARRNGLKPGPNKTFIHEDPLRTARFELIGSPPAFMYGFSGIKHSQRQLQENIELWIEHRTEQNPDLPMRAFPAVIATQGCFAWRNAAPLALSNREMLGIGNDEAPVRLIILQLLYLLNRRLNVTTDGYGLKPNLSSYLTQFAAPKFEHGIGDVDHLVKLRLADGDNSAADQEKRLQPARDHSSGASGKPAAEPAKVEPPSTEPEKKDDSLKASSKPDPAPKPAENKPATPAVREAAAAASAVVSKKPEAKAEVPAKTEAPRSSASAGVFDTPSPFAKAPPPAPEVDKEKPAPAPRVPSAPLGSAPIPGMTGSPASKPRAAPLGSAPIPGIDSAGGKDDAPAKPPVAPLGSAPIPMSEPVAPKPPVDIEVTGDIPLIDGNQGKDTPDFESTMVIAPEPRPRAEPPAEESKADAEPDFESTMVIAPEPRASATPGKPEESKADAEPDFESTMVITPDAALSNKPAGGNSTEAFIDRVKEQLSSGDDKDKEKDGAYVSTTPV